MRRLLPAEMFSRPYYWFTLLLLFMAALLAMGLVLQYGFGVIPCKMCWWQRYAHLAIAGFAAAGLLTSGKAIQRLCALGILGSALTGLFIACWQYAAQHGLLPFPASCTGDGTALSDAANMLTALQNIQIIPCDKEGFTLFGLSLAGWNIPAMVLVTYITIRGGWKI